MAQRYEVQVKIISQKGTCAKGHKVGDEFIVGGITPAGLCCSAFNSMFPSIHTLRFGGTFPYSKDPDTAEVACPDADNPIVFELRRVPVSE